MLLTIYWVDGGELEGNSHAYASAYPATTGAVEREPVAGADGAVGGLRGIKQRDYQPNCHYCRNRDACGDGFCHHCCNIPTHCYEHRAPESNCNGHAAACSNGYAAPKADTHAEATNAYAYAEAQNMGR